MHLPRLSPALLLSLALPACAGLGGGASAPGPSAAPTSAPAGTPTAPVATTPAVAAPPPRAAHPNFLIILADDIGVDKLGAYADDVPGARTADLPVTPQLDGLAQAGLRFTSAWAAPVCSPTRAMIQTGQYGFRTGVSTTVPPGPGLASDAATFAQALVTSGYTTGLFGKWHLGTQGVRGSDDWRLADGQTMKDVADGPAPLRFGWQTYDGNLDGRIDDYHGWTRVQSQGNDRAVITQETRYATDVTTDVTLAWIQQQRGPWAAMVTYNAPHSDGEDRSYEADDIDPSCPARPRNDTPTAVYAALVQCLDDRVGKLINGIPAASLRDTVILFIGDNGTEKLVIDGPFLPTTGREYGKATAYETGVHVPYLVTSGQNWQERAACLAAGATAPCSYSSGVVAQPGRVVKAPVSVVDVAATLTSLAGTGLPSATDSVSFAGCLSGSSPTCNTGGAPRVLYTETYRSTAARGVSTGAAALRSGDQKLVIRYIPPGKCVRYEVYDLASDPLETRDLAAQKDAGGLDLLTTALTTLHPPWLDGVPMCTGAMGTSGGGGRGEGGGQGGGQRGGGPRGGGGPKGGGVRGAPGEGGEGGLRGGHHPKDQ